jgi:type III restriction enzyme
MLQLKEYQRDCVKTMEQYFLVLAEEQEKYLKVPEEIRKEYPLNYPEKAWHKLFPIGDSNHAYCEKITGHRKPCPNFCLKIPTGGGKTLLATHAISLFFHHIEYKKTGFVLWIVPSEQIYSQTVNALKDRAHPYRQSLDAICGGRVKIITKKDRFAPQDTEENLVILVMMLQSFSRDTLKKEMLKFFQDNGKFDEFFPLESNQQAQKALFDEFPNLDLESAFESLLGGKIKTSFGNVVKILRPFIILDEGHKAKSDLAKSAIQECNPSAVCELTATPTETANILYSVSGRELEKEDMIKLDMHLIEKNTDEWKILLSHSIEHLNDLQKKADEYREKAGIYIRPINLIQVEATGKDQRKEGKIHADDAKEFLISTGLVQPDQIAIKTSAQNEIEGIDLLSDQCPIRFIITKQALQEGWDCPFAYSLTILSNSRSITALTQLAGRVLRQPNARKTGIKELDESYVFCLKDSSKNLISGIRSGFELDGMSDLVERIIPNESRSLELGEQKTQVIREKFKNSLNDFFLPAFVVQDHFRKGKVRIVDFTADILPEICFEEIDLTALEGVFLPQEPQREVVRSIHFRQIAQDSEEFLAIQESERMAKESPELVKSFWVQFLLDLIPNPWKAMEIVQRAIDIFAKKFSLEKVAQHQSFLLGELKKVLEGTDSKKGEIERLAKDIFRKKLERDEIRFVPHFTSERFQPEVYFEKQARNILPFQTSLFEPFVGDSLNGLEQDTAYEIDTKEKTFWWYRNKSNKPGRDFFLVAWKREKFYPDFIFTTRNGDPESFDTIYVLETKGDHLARSLDSEHKQDLTKLYCSAEIQQDWHHHEAFPKTLKKVRFEFVSESQITNVLNKIFSESL